MRSPLVVSALFLAVAASGCGGPSQILPKGKLTNGGKSVLPDRRGGMTMVFIPEPPTGHTYPAAFNTDDDTFAVYGPHQKGIPQGKYHVTLSLMATTTTPDGKDLPEAAKRTLLQTVDQFNAKYNEKTTPILIDVTGSDLNIDLSQFQPK
jgi:hypothetical protein